MRPYLAVLKDSFREAFSSRVLWIMLGFTTLGLIALAPIGIVENAGLRVQPNQIYQIESFLARLHAGREGAGPVRRIWDRLSEPMRDQVSKTVAAGSLDEWSPFDTARLIQPLNELLEDPAFYVPADWQDVALSDDARLLAERGPAQLEGRELVRLNRLLLEAAFPGELAPSRTSEIDFTYAGMSIVDGFPMSKEQILQSTLQTFVPLFAGTIGVFAAILVTASIVPHTFEAGAIDLLLSKPVSRSLLFLAKFFGGCAFTLINASYLIVGLFLILGLRHGYWNQKLLLCVPVFMFLFAIYYGVSATAGVIWKNPIVSVVLTIIFWFACFVVGVLKTAVADIFIINPDRVTSIVDVAGTPAVANEVQDVLWWSAENQAWLRAIEPDQSNPRLPRFIAMGGVLGPVYLPESRRLVAYSPQFSQIGMSYPARPLLLAEMADPQANPAPGNEAPVKQPAAPSSPWKTLPGVNSPSGIRALFADQGAIIAVTPAGVWRCDGDLKSQGKAELKPFGVSLLSVDRGAQFVQISERLSLGNNLSAALAGDGKRLAIFDGAQLVVLSRGDDGRFAISASRKFDTREAGLVACGGSSAVVAFASGRVEQFDIERLETISEHRPEGGNAPRSIKASADGAHVAVLFHNRRAWLLDAASGKPHERRPAYQGEISAIAFAADGRLLTADHVDRVIEYDAKTMSELRRFEQQPSTFRSLYWNVLSPAYSIFPKPGELQNLVSYFLTDEETVATGPNPDDLTATRVKFDVYGPIWSNLGFLAVVLAFGCLYVARKDF